MSLEAAIQENTATLRELIALWSKSPMAAPKADKPFVPPVGPTAPKEAKEAKAKLAAQAEPQAPLDYEKHVRPAVLGYAAKHGSQAIVALLSRHGVTSAKALKPEQWAAVIDDCTKTPGEIEGGSDAEVA